MKLTKTMLNPSIHLVEGNDKLIGDFLIFNLPARMTCPYRTQTCDFVCYAAAEEFRPNVVASRVDNLEQSIKDTFVNDMIQHLEFQLTRSKWAGKIIYVRIHSSGDYYNQEYFNKWVAITEHFKDEPRLIFQSYTKSLVYVINHDIDNINIQLVYSVMPDTKPENIETARELGMKLFHAVPIGSIPQNAFQCAGNCGPCTVCYDKNSTVKDIYIEFHGNRARLASK